MTIRLAIAALAGATLLSAGVARAEQHLVTPEQARQRMAGAAAQRDTDLARLRASFSSAEAAAAAETIGVNLASVQSRLATLNDGELHELATRAAALDSDPVAGAFTRRQLWIGIIVLAVILLVIIIA